MAITKDDVAKRLTASGVDWYFDPDGGSLDDQQQAQVDEAIEYANEIVEGYRPQNDLMNRTAAWVKHQAVDIAAYRIGTHYGQAALESLQVFYEIAIENLEAWSQGQVISDADGGGATVVRAAEFMNVPRGR